MDHVRLVARVFAAALGVAAVCGHAPARSPLPDDAHASSSIGSSEPGEPQPLIEAPAPATAGERVETPIENADPDAAQPDRSQRYRSRLNGWAVSYTGEWHVEEPEAVDPAAADEAGETETIEAIFHYHDDHAWIAVSFSPQRADSQSFDQAAEASRRIVEVQKGEPIVTASGEEIRFEAVRVDEDAKSIFMRGVSVQDGTELVLFQWRFFTATGTVTFNGYTSVFAGLNHPHKFNEFVAGVSLLPGFEHGGPMSAPGAMVMRRHWDETARWSVEYGTRWRLVPEDELNYKYGDEVERTPAGFPIVLSAFFELDDGWTNLDVRFMPCVVVDETWSLAEQVVAAEQEQCRAGGVTIPAVQGIASGRFTSVELLRERALIIKRGTITTDEGVREAVVQYRMITRSGFIIISGFHPEGRPPEDLDELIAFMDAITPDPGTEFTDAREPASRSTAGSGGTSPGLPANPFTGISCMTLWIALMVILFRAILRPFKRTAPVRDKDAFTEYPISRD